MQKDLETADHPKKERKKERGNTISWFSQTPGRRAFTGGFLFLLFLFSIFLFPFFLLGKEAFAIWLAFAGFSVFQRGFLDQLLWTTAKGRTGCFVYGWFYSLRNLLASVFHTRVVKENASLGSSARAVRPPFGHRRLLVFWKIFQRTLRVGRLLPPSSSLSREDLPQYHGRPARRKLGKIIHE